jgi:hypothetical protein
MGVVAKILGSEQSGFSCRAREMCVRNEQDRTEG